MKPGRKTFKEFLPLHLQEGSGLPVEMAAVVGIDPLAGEVAADRVHPLVEEAVPDLVDPAEADNICGLE